MMSNNIESEGIAGSVNPDSFRNPFEWRFLNEPLWRWFLFLVAMSFILGAWNGVLRMMKE